LGSPPTAAASRVLVGRHAGDGEDGEKMLLQPFLKMTTISKNLDENMLTIF
jgi:hypothetical protein